MRNRRRLVYGLDGRRLGVELSPATKRDAFYLDGVEISRNQATRLALDHVGGTSINDALRAAHFRDCTPADQPVQTAAGLYWHDLVPIRSDVFDLETGAEINLATGRPVQAGVEMNNRGVKLSNEYAQQFEFYADIPKAVFAAIAFSLAMRLHADDPGLAIAEFYQEWRTLNANGIVPQRAPEFGRSK